MELSDRDEELLEQLWIALEEDRQDSLSLEELGAGMRKSAQHLAKVGLATTTNGGLVLTKSGSPLARNVVRRHRLAERLLVDVLGAVDINMHDKACQFEHILDLGLDEAICTLLGHPKICPHGKPIPPGRCCQQDQAGAQRVVSPLSAMSSGQEGKVAYVHAPETGQLQKLMAMGLLPGAAIQLIQSFPSYVFRVNKTQFAVDKSIADAIYVRLIQEEEVITADTAPRRQHRWGWGRLRPQQ